MDEAFYARMVTRFEEGELDEEELSVMLDAHLSQVEEFEAQLRQKLRRRRRHRQVGNYINCLKEIKKKTGKCSRDGIREN